jgi:Rhodopirellula transposase DDE domain
LVAPHTAGDPMSERKWLNCRLADLEEELDAQGHGVSRPVISRLLRAQDYDLHVNVKEVEGTDHSDRDTQFQYIQEQREQHLAADHACLSVDTKKKELIGNFKNAGQSWGTHAERVNVHDFPSDAEGRAVPYGIYDQQHNCGTLYVGQSADTPTFAVDNIVRWCETEKPVLFPNTTELLIEADSGGSNSARSRVWKQLLQEKIADRFGLTVTVCHYPTGCSKWNPIEHRLFSEVSKTWAGCPLRSWELMLQYISETQTETGLTVRAVLVTQQYETGIKVSDEVMDGLNLEYHDVCPQWNYTIRPRPATTLN